MGKYLKLFKNHNQYTAFTQTEEFIKPNVSHCIQENEVHYNPIKPYGKIKIDKTTDTYKVLWDVHVPKFDISNVYRSGVNLVFGQGPAMGAVIAIEGEWAIPSSTLSIVEENNMYHMYNLDLSTYHKSWGFDEIHFVIYTKENSDSETTVLYDIILEQEDITP